MELKLQAFDFAAAVKRAGLTTSGHPIGSKPRLDAPAFQGAFADALKSVSAAQHEATRLQREVQLDNPSVGIEQTMIAMQKAQIGFQAALQVRNRLVQAYTDIMNMPV
jgi:flagellar hook-basal body complex protein FliE